MEESDSENKCSYAMDAACVCCVFVVVYCYILAREGVVHVCVQAYSSIRGA